MKKTIFLALILIALLLTLTCDIYNKSVPEYLDKYTNTASVAEHTFTNGTLADPQGRVYSGIVQPNSIIELKLRNPKNYQLLTYLEYYQGGSWIPFSRAEAPGDYSTVENTSTDFAGLVITVKYNPTDQIRINIAGAKIGESYKLRIKLNDRETRREFEAYELPALTCSDYPEALGFFAVDIADVDKGLFVTWHQLLRGLTGDLADANKLVISCSDLGIQPETYTRDFNNTTMTWSSWSPAGRIVEHLGAYTIILAENITLTPQRIYHVTLRFTNIAGVAREITESLSSGEGVARVTIGSQQPLEYATLKSAFGSINDGQTATVTLLKNVFNQEPIIIEGAGKDITFNSQSLYTVQLGATHSGSLLTVDNGATLRLGGAASMGTLTLRGKSGNNSALVSVSGGGTLELSDRALITGNTSSLDGGGVFVSGTFNMHGGSIEGNTTILSGGGVFVAYGSSFTMKGGTIKSNIATGSNNGGGVFAEGSFVMSNGIIERNEASRGGGVYVLSSGSFAMSGGTVYGTDNSSLQNIARSGVTGGASLYVDGGSAIYTGDYGTNIDIIDSGNYINATLPPYVARVTINGSDTLHQSLGEAFARVDNNQTATITVFRNIEDQDPVTISGTGKTITLVSEGNNIIDLASNTRMFIIDGNVTLKIGSATSGELILRGRTANTLSLIYIDTGTLELYANAKIKDNKNSANGGGVYINSGTFNMYGGSIEGNSALYGAGIYIVGNGTFTMSGGSIEGNSANGGGGVYAAGNGTFTMSGGSIIGNSAVEGGGVYIAGNRTFTMSGSATGTIISNNNATDYGGGVFVNGGRIIMNGGTIYGSTEIASLSNKAPAGRGASLLLASGTAVYGTAFGSGTITSAGDVDYTLPEQVAQIGAGTIYPTLSSAINAATGTPGSPAQITVLKSINTPEAGMEDESGYTISANKHIRLVAASSGATITSGTGGFALFTVSGSASLILGGASSGALILDGSTVTATSNRMGVSSYGTFTMDNNATIRNFRNTANGAGVYISNNQTFTMNAGTIESNSASNGAGVYISTNAQMSMSGAALITNNSSTVKGGGVYVDNGQMTMGGGRIENNMATSNSGCGGGICVGGGTLTINSASAVINNNSVNNANVGNTGAGGAGVYFAGTTFTMTAGVISNNIVRGGDNYGGGVFLYSGTFNMSSGSIEKNNGYNGAGIYVYNAEFNISGNAVIKGNESDSGFGGGIYNAGRFNMGGGTVYGNEPEYGIDRNTAAIGQSLFMISGTGSAYYVSPFSPGIISTPLSYGGNIFTNATLPDFEAMIESTGKGYFSLETAIEDVPVGVGSPTSPTRITILKDINTPTGSMNTIPANKHVQLVAGARDIAITANTGVTRLFNINNNASLTLGENSGKTITLDGNEATATEERHAVYNDRGTFTMNNTAIIKNFRSTASGAGLYLDSSSTSIMNGGSIHENTGIQSGGVHITGGGIFEMRGGSIQGNTATSSGGGVYVENGTFDMYNGFIENNKATSYGGGVYVATSGNFDIPISSTGIIRGNEVSNSGGGVCVWGGTFTMRAGTIGGTEASNQNKAWNGGGVHITGGGTLEMRGGSILGNNTTNSFCGGVYVENGTFDMYNGVIEKNSAWSFGGGVYVSANGNFNMPITSTGIIRGNEVSSSGSGGGVCVFGGTFTMGGGTIGGTGAANQNKAYNGGGVFVSTGTFNFQGGVIGTTGTGIANEASNSGGGVYFAGGTFNISGSALIKGNTCVAYGGGVYSQSSFEMSNGTIEANTATGTASSGGGVFVRKGADATIFTMSGGVIQTNSANYGGGVYVYNDAEMRMNHANASIKGNNATGSTLANGGGVFAEGTFTMIAGTIENNNAVNGAGVCVATGSFSMPTGSIAVIQGNTATGSGGGVSIESGGSFSMLSGTIQNNSSTGTAANNRGGGGVYVSDNSSLFTMFNGTILNNSATGYGGGVYVYNNGAFNMNDNARVTVSATNNDIYLAATRTINVANINAGDKIGRITPATASYNPGTAVISAGNFNTRFDVTPQGTTEWCIDTTGRLQYAVARVQSSGAATNFLSLTDALNSIPNANVIATVSILRDITNQGPCTISNTGTGTRDITLVSQGGSWTITLGSTNGSLFTVGNSVQFTIGSASGTGLTLKGRASNNAALVFVNGGTLVLNATATISDNENTQIGSLGLNGGGVYVGSGTFTMNGGIIERNTASTNGGGVYIVGGTMTMNSATAFIRNNIATNGDGGGVAITAGNLIMNTGTISYNKSTDGGGVHLTGTSAEFTMTSGTIQYNGVTSIKASQKGGGGVSVRGGAVFNMGTAANANPVIQNNSSSTAIGIAYEGGGVFVYGATFNMLSGVIQNNGVGGIEAGAPSLSAIDGYGGGVLLKSGSTFIMGVTSGTTTPAIRNNSKRLDGTGPRGYGGGGVAIFGASTFTMYAGSTIEGNETRSDGGGVLIWSGTFDMYGGVIKDNDATITDETNKGYGGGVALWDGNTNFNMRGGRIESNRAKWGGGVSSQANFTMYGGTIYGDPATPTTSANTALNGGAAYYHINGIARFSNLNPINTTNNTITYP